MRQKLSFILLAGLYFGGAVWFFSEKATFVQPVLAQAHPTNTPVPTPTPTTPPGGGTGCVDDKNCTSPQVCNPDTHKCEDPSAECPNTRCEAGETYVSCPEDCQQSESTICNTITCADGSSGYTICDPSCTAPDRHCWPDCRSGAAGTWGAGRTTTATTQAATRPRPAPLTPPPHRRRGTWDNRRIHSRFWG